MALAITDNNFEELLQSGKPLVIDFWATWCGPCKQIGPSIEELATEYQDKVTVGKCDIEENDDLVSKFGIRNVPTVLFIKNGEVVDKQVGAAAKSVFQAKIDSLL
ncbi:thioredoxin [uncultured Bacteroides sp.]|jgi:thioredoxin 1|uniref:thioredoxin n=1 Tax=uncultured Bacteroides sp. TaxID=162156 RepID=UPI002AA69E53|nr:thioredoxin [uncultured Bacteroides sp.]